MKCGVLFNHLNTNKVETLSLITRRFCEFSDTECQASFMFLSSRSRGMVLGLVLSLKRDHRVAKLDTWGLSTANYPSCTVAVLLACQ